MIRNAPLIDLLKELNETDECEDLEAKHISALDVGRSTYETICSLSNEPSLKGGTILLGIQKEEAALFPAYVPVGVADPEKLSADIASGCAGIFNQPIRVDIKPIKIGNATILKIDVPELSITYKPLYFKKDGLPKGAYRRIGPSDIKCTDEDLQAFFQGKANDPYDLRIVSDAVWDDIDPAAITAYRKARADANPLAEELSWSDEDMLRSLNAVRRIDDSLKITVAGIVVFGKAASIRRLFPALRVDYIRVPGKTWMDDPETKLESIDMRGSVLSIIGRVIAAITDDLPKTLMIEDKSGQRSEVPVIPLRVLREAVVNALMHRSYQVFQPTQVIRYANRIVIKNPGFSLKSQDRFDEPGSCIRNPTIAEVLHETRYAETKGSGIRVMQQKMKESGLAVPTFESDRDADTFTATFLFHHFLGEADWAWLAKFSELELTEDQLKALIFVREVGAIDNATYRTLTQTDTLAASKSLRMMREMDLLDDRGSGARTHYVPGEAMIRLGNMDAKALVSLPSMDASSHNMEGRSPSQKQLLTEMPVPLRMLVRNCQLSSRLSPEKSRQLIERLCDWRPLSLAEIASLLFRTPTYLSQKFITPMIDEGKLTYLHPEMVQHPGQKYQTPRLAQTGKGKK